MTVDKRPCTNCQQNLATVKFTRILNGHVDEQYLCRQCAAQKSPYQKKNNNITQLDDIINSILLSGGQIEISTETPEAETPREADVTCRTCGLPFASYRETLLLGCSDCYSSFGDLLSADIKRIHGATEHVGRVPNAQAQQVKDMRTANDLRNRLAMAVKAEDFMLAAKLRDQLKALEEKASEADTPLPDPL